MTNTYRVYEGQKYHEFDHDTIEKMKELGLIRFYGTRVVNIGGEPGGGTKLFTYRPTPRSRKVGGRKW